MKKNVHNLILNEVPADVVAAIRNNECDVPRALIYAVDRGNIEIVWAIIERGIAGQAEMRAALIAATACNKTAIADIISERIGCKKDADESLSMGI